MIKKNTAGLIVLAKKVFYIFLLQAGAGYSVSSYASEVAVPGYRWESCPKVDCSLLIPNLWRLRAVRSESPVRFEVSRAKADRKSYSKLKVTILTDAEKQTGFSVEKNFEILSRDISRFDKVLNTWKRDSDIFSSIAFSGIRSEAPESLNRQFTLMIANKNTGTIYIMSLLSTILNWEKDWHTFQRTFSQLRLNENV